MRRTFVRSASHTLTVCDVSSLFLINHNVSASTGWSRAQITVSRDFLLGFKNLFLGVVTLERGEFIHRARGKAWPGDICLNSSCRGVQKWLLFLCLGQWQCASISLAS